MAGIQALAPWLALAAAGALHGLNPAAGWALAAWSGRAGARGGSLRALLSIALGHAASLVIVAAGVSMALRLGVAFDARLLQGVAAVLLAWLVLLHVRGRAHPVRCVSAHRAGIALWSFIVACGHGAGWMLVPALVPLCASGMPGREITASGSVLLALAAVGVHMTAMLSTSAAVAAVARWGMRWGRAQVAVSAKSPPALAS